jgi:hypothetical protein
MLEVSKPDAPLLPGQLVPREPGEERLVPLHRASLIVAGAILAGLLAAFAVARWVPLNDPVDVVGVPLLTGYSERVEQASFYTYILTTLLLAGTLSRLRIVERIPCSVLAPAGALALLVPSCLPAWSTWPSTLPAACLTGVLAYLVGSFWVARGWDAGRCSSLALAVALLVWGVGFPQLPMILVSEWRYVTGAVLVVLTARAFYRRLPAFHRAERVDWRHAAAALLVTFGTMITNAYEFRFATIGALGFLLGRYAGRSRRGLSALGGPAWLVYVASLVLSFSLAHQWSFLRPVRTVLAVAGGAGGVAVLTLALPSGLRLRRERFGTEAGWERWFPYLAVGGLVLANLAHPWFAAMIAGSALVIAAKRLHRVWRTAAALALAVVLMLAFLPGPPNTTIDSFHDGQVLGNVWEFESGRPLYTEVFPLRSYEFFLTWLARRVAKPALANFFIANRILDSLPIAGVFLLTFAWTRSLPWSFATALAAATYPPTSSRMALPLLAAAVEIAVFRSRRRLSLAWIAVAAWLAALLGFDVLIPLVGSSVLTIAIAGPPGRARAGEASIRSPRRMAFARLSAAALLLLGCIVPFLLMLALWQGERAVFAYCWLLVDNARNLPAFYGLPLPWGDFDSCLLMTSGLMIVGTWAASGVLSWPFRGDSRRSIWLCLLVSYVLIAHRALGRSDPAHLSILIYTNLVFGSLLLFEGLRYLAHRGILSPLLNRPVFAFAAMVAACGLGLHRGYDPRDVVRWVREVSARPIREAPLSPFVLERVGPRDYLWEMEGGMLNYRYQRHNPTRHSIAYTICSPAEQRIAIEALRSHPPRLIAWMYMSGSNGIPNPLRYYLLAAYVYRHYRPFMRDGAPYLEPSPAGWTGQVDLEPPFLGSLPLGRLALRWGKDRTAGLSGRVRKRQTLDSWREQQARVWESEGSIDSRLFNYLKLDLACRMPPGSSPCVVEAILEFAPPGRGYEEDSRVTFDVIPDGAVRPYLIPIGCSPGWSWRPGIARIRLSIPAADQVSPPRGQCWQIDEIGGGATASGKPGTDAQSEGVAGGVSGNPFQTNHALR